MTKAEARVELPDWSFVKVQSCADGSMRVIPRWRGIKAGGALGLFTRMDAASRLQAHLNAAPSRSRRGGRK